MSERGAMEEVRKLQLTGGSTYIVSLPKGWVEKMGLKKGSKVNISQMDDMTLRAPALRLIVESVMRTAEYGADIAEVVLNLTIRDEIRGG